MPALNRREAILATLAAFVAGDMAAHGTAARTEPVESLAELEARSGGRLGVAFLDTATGQEIAYRADERFPMCSTFKLLAVAATLSRVDGGAERLDRMIHFKSTDLVAYSPVTALQVNAPGMPVHALCEAAMTQSDNTAANLLLAALGGPPALTRYAQSIGDPMTRLDRIEPLLNEAADGDVRDTTTPRHMRENLRTLLLGGPLSPDSRALLSRWLIANKTGSKRVRAGMPTNWAVGDKTGSGDNGTTNDVAVAWPQSAAPLFIAVYLTRSILSGDDRDALLADVARLMTRRTPG